MGRGMKHRNRTQKISAKKFHFILFFFFHKKGEVSRREEDVKNVGSAVPQQHETKAFLFFFSLLYCLELIFDHF